MEAYGGEEEEEGILDKRKQALRQQAAKQRNAKVASKLSVFQGMSMTLAGLFSKVGFLIIFLKSI